MIKGDIVCFIGGIRVVDGLDLARTTWGFTVMPFDVEYFFYRNNIAKSKDIIST